jgi:sulfur relay (sulfurtransferase) DsrC/TusE family protein
MVPYDKAWRTLANARFPCNLHGFAMPYRLRVYYYLSGLIIIIKLSRIPVNAAYIVELIQTTSSNWQRRRWILFSDLRHQTMRQSHENYSKSHRNRVKVIIASTSLKMCQSHWKCVKVVENVSTSSKMHQVIKHMSKSQKMCQSNWKSVDFVITLLIPKHVVWRFPSPIEVW